MNGFRYALFFIAFLPSVIGFGGDPPPFDTDSLRIPARSPEEALESFHLPENLDIELVAHEPNVFDPVAMTFDERGRIYVCEMRGYPAYAPLPEGQGTVRLLEDLDGDGFYETSYPFAEGMNSPSGVAPWKGGVFITATPDIWYLKDTDGDGIADLREKVFTGFDTDTLERVSNNLAWGLDQKIYGVTCSSGGEIQNLRDPGSEPVMLRSVDFRFDPSNLKLEPISGTAIFGNSFDQWGNRFICSTGDVFHQVLSFGYLKRDPHLTLSDTLERISTDGPRVYRSSPPEPWRVVRKKHWEGWVDTSHALRAERFSEMELTPTGFFTSGTGVTVYRGSALPVEYHENLLQGEVAGNLVHRRVLKDDGATFTAHRVEEESEFLTSEDNWFRPTNFSNGPDGCLYVLDMYRETIEDPSAIPPDILKHLDSYSGMDRGRIYRIIPKGFSRPSHPELNGVDTQELVELLEHPESWWRETAHRLLFERQDPSAVEPLRKRVRNAELPQSRLLALYSLSGQGELKVHEVFTALKDPDPRVRVHALRLAETLLRK